jgi:hypothetical protein
MGQEFDPVEKRIVANMVGMVVGVEEIVDPFSSRQLPEGLFFTGGVCKKSPAAFHQKGVAIGIVGILSEKDFYRPDFLSLDHVPLMEKPVPFRWGKSSQNIPTLVLPEDVKKFNSSGHPGGNRGSVNC